MAQTTYELWKDDLGHVHIKLMVKYQDGRQSVTFAELSIPETRVFTSALGALIGKEEEDHAESINHQDVPG